MISVMESLALPQAILKHISFTDAANLCFPTLAASRGLASGHVDGQSDMSSWDRE
jgi:hypothetical protein